MIAVQERNSLFVAFDPNPQQSFCCRRHTLGQGVYEWTIQNQAHQRLAHADCTGHHEIACASLTAWT